MSCGYVSRRRTAPSVYNGFLIARVQQEIQLFRVIVDPNGYNNLFDPHLSYYETDCNLLSA